MRLVVSKSCDDIVVRSFNRRTIRSVEKQLKDVYIIAWGEDEEKHHVDLNWQLRHGTKVRNCSAPCLFPNLYWFKLETVLHEFSVHCNGLLEDCSWIFQALGASCRVLCETILDIVLYCFSNPKLPNFTSFMSIECYLELRTHQSSCVVTYSWSPWWGAASKGGGAHSEAQSIHCYSFQFSSFCRTKLNSMQGVQVDTQCGLLNFSNIALWERSCHSSSGQPVHHIAIQRRDGDLAKCNSFEKNNSSLLNWWSAVAWMLRNEKGSETCLVVPETNFYFPKPFARILHILVICPQQRG
jgi:hypothetical protein